MRAAASSSSVVRRAVSASARLRPSLPLPTSTSTTTSEGPRRTLFFVAPPPAPRPAVASHVRPSRSDPADLLRARSAHVRARAAEPGGGSGSGGDVDDDRGGGADLIRLSKRMSELDLCSRREADRLIAAGRVAVRGSNAGTVLGVRVPADETDIVVVTSPGEDAPAANGDDPTGRGDPESGTAARTAAFDWDRMRGDVVALNKPRGYVSGQPEHPAVQIPAVRLLTRTNLHLREGVPEDEELWDALRGGTFHFARRFGMQQVRRGAGDRRRGRGGGRSSRDGSVAREVEWKDSDGADEGDLPRPEATLSGYVPAGRLDRASSGLLLFTRSGVFAKKLVSADSAVDKEYVALVRPAQSPTREEVRSGLTRLPRPNRNLRPLLNGGRTLHGDARPLKPLVEAEWLESPDLRNAQAPPGALRLVLREGRKHQVRRMCREVLGLHCVALERTRVGPVSHEGLPEGMWRPLRKEEARSIFLAGRKGGGK